MKTLIIFLMLISLSGCDDQISKGSDLISHVNTSYKIRTIVKTDGIAWFSRMREGVFRFADESGMDCTFSGPPRAEKELQLELIQQAIADKVDAICIVPFDVESVEPALQQAREAGIVVIAHEASNIKNADIIIEAFNNRDYGEHLMDHLAFLMDEKGDYLVFIGSFGSRTHIEWMSAAVKYQKEQYPLMSVQDKWIECFDEQSIVYSQTMDAIANNPEMKGVLGAPMSTATGAGTAVVSLGLSKEISVVSTGLVSSSSEFLENGSVDLISFWDPLDAGYIMNLLAVMTLEGMSIQDEMDLLTSGYQQITKDKVRSNLYYGSSWTDVTRDNMSEYAF